MIANWLMTNAKCEICGGSKKPVMFGHTAGWAAHEVAECLMELRRRIEALEERNVVFSQVVGPVKFSPDGELMRSDMIHGPHREKDPK